MRPRTDDFTYHGHRLVYDTYGEGDHLVVYLHGLLVDSDLNRGIATALAACGNRVVLLDLLGHGRSDKPTHATDYRIDAYADQVIALLDELGAPAAVLGGMSLGANVSLFTAAAHPDRVSGLVLEMPVLEWAVPSAAMLFVPLLLAVHYARSVVGVAAAAFRRLPSTGSSSIDSLVHAAGLPPETMAAILHGVLVGPVAPTLEERSAIDAPALVLGHRNDLIHPFDDAANLTDQLPNATLLTAASPLELRRRPERLVPLIAEFLDGIWAGTRADQRTEGDPDFPPAMESNSGL